jgi:3-methyladenine DNA glycosylase AlkD
MTTAVVSQLLRRHSSRLRARAVARYFKTGKGEYGEGDVFIGVTMPDTRKVARDCLLISRTELKQLLSSRVHEERMLALLILVDQFERANEHDREAIYNFYLLNTRRINNWDLVDVSAGKIVGAYLLSKPKTILYKLAKSKNVWERRIAIIASSAFIKRGQSEITFKIADMLRHDNHDLIHKAVGWMLREVGKSCSRETLQRYLKPRYARMPRTMLRYAIEHFPQKLRTQYLEGKV